MLLPHVHDQDKIHVTNGQSIKLTVELNIHKPPKGKRSGLQLTESDIVPPSSV